MVHVVHCPLEEDYYEIEQNSFPSEELNNNT